jgi:hypothetical protein
MFVVRSFVRSAIGFKFFPDLGRAPKYSSVVPGAVLPNVAGLSPMLTD